MFGIGTAIGELPPYFVARAASLANKKLEELEEVSEAKHDSNYTFKNKIVSCQKWKCWFTRNCRKMHF